MKVKQIVSELYNGIPSPNEKQATKYTVAPSTAPTTPGQAKTVTLVPQGSAPSQNGAPVPGSITVNADQVDMTDPANPKISQQALQGQSQNQQLTQQPGALNNKTVTVGAGLGEQPNEDFLGQMGSMMNQQQPVPGRNEITPQDSRNTLTVAGKNPDGSLRSSNGDPIMITSTKREVDQAYINDPVNKGNSVGYIKHNGKTYMALNTGHKWKVGPKAFAELSTQLPQEAQGESGIARIAKLAGIK